MKKTMRGKKILWSELKGLKSQMMYDFEELWRFVMKRTERGVMTVQDKAELEHVFNLMRAANCASYLEVGSAEGNSLYVLTHALLEGAHVLSVNIEDHTKTARQDVIKLLGPQWPVYQKTGNSTDPKTIADVKGKYDCVLIDAGHSYEEVLSDAVNYGAMAQKYIFFHDIQLPEVKRAVEEYASRTEQSYSTFINSDHFGYAIFSRGEK